MEYDRPRPDEFARIGPSASSKARRESSELLEWCGRGGEGEFEGDLNEAYDDSREDVIE
jgi:hypothetical protein